ncbi:hypothetical protein [Streptococcus australis]|uniref:hypothetical protein n=1 Tax=Streptococcus australis TaxID=113107 RepID=UPI0034A314E8
MLVETDSDVDVDSNSEACLREADSEALAEIDALNSDTLVDAEVDTLADSELNSDTDVD